MCSFIHILQFMTLIFFLTPRLIQTTSHFLSISITFWHQPRHADQNQHKNRILVESVNNQHKNRISVESVNKTELNNLRMIICLKKSEVSLELISVCNVIENLMEHGIHCLALAFMQEMPSSKSELFSNLFKQSIGLQLKVMLFLIQASGSLLLAVPIAASETVYLFYCLLFFVRFLYWLETSGGRHIRFARILSYVLLLDYKHL